MNLYVLLEMLRTFYAQTSTMPESMVLPTVAWDSMAAEAARDGKYRLAEGGELYGHLVLPTIYLETGHGVVRLERKPDWRSPTPNQSPVHRQSVASEEK